MADKKQKTFVIAVKWTVAKAYQIEAANRKEAMAIIEEQLNNGELSYFDDGYESVEGKTEYLGMLNDEPCVLVQ